MVNKQRGVSLSGALVGMIVVAVVGLLAAQLLPAYNEYFSVKKMIKAMVDGGEIKGTVNEIRNTYDRRNAVEDVAAVKGADLDITKEGGQTVIRAEWSKKLPLAGNISICADFSVSSAP